jgi:uncharacterized protein (DUF433 family)
MSQTTGISAEKSHITSTAGVCGGRPCIAGSRIRVQDIYIWHERQGQSPDEIVAKFPQLQLADVYAALAYFWDNRDAILHDLEVEARLVEEMKQKTPSKLEAKLKAIKTDGNPVSS